MSLSKRLLVFDLDGTLTQHRTEIGEENLRVLQELSLQNDMLMVGAGDCTRIFRQLRCFPINIIGNYGMQTAIYDRNAEDIRVVDRTRIEPDRESITEKINMLRAEFGFNDYSGETVEFHDSGMVTFPILGTKARIEDKLCFDPDRSKRRPLYSRVCEVFSDFNVFIGGSSSFDMAPKPYCKSFALLKYADEHGYSKDDITYFGDDYQPGGNDCDVYKLGIDFICVDDYRRFGVYVEEHGLI